MVLENMSGAVNRLACRDRLRSSDDTKKKHNDDIKKKVRIDVEEGEKMCKGDGSAKRMKTGSDTEEQVKMWSHDKKAAAEHRKTESAAEKPVKMCNHDKNEKHRKTGSDAEELGKMPNRDKNAKNRETSSKFFEKEKKKKMLSSHNDLKNMQSGDDRDRKRSMPISSNKIHVIEKNETSKRAAPIASVAKENKMWTGDTVVIKMRKNKEDAEIVLQKDSTPQKFTTDNKERKRIVPLTPKKMRANGNKTYNVYEEKRKARRSDDKEFSTDNKKKKRKVPPTPFEKQAHSKKKAFSDDKDKEKKAHSNVKEKEKPPLAFFKFICHDFDKFLLIPPTFAPKLENLTNQHVYVKDVVGNSSKILISMVDGSLAFHEGWNNFVSDHLIQWGDFLLFEYTGKSTFVVRVFGTDSCERLQFNIGSEGKVGKKKQNPNSEDIDGSPHVSGEYSRSKGLNKTVDPRIIPSNLVATSANADSETHHVAVNIKDDPTRVQNGVGRGSLGALHNKKGNLANKEYKTKSSFTSCIQERTRKSELIIIPDTAPSTQENEDALKQTTLSAASHSSHVAINRIEDPERVASGVCGQPSVALNIMEAYLGIGECKAKNISPVCSKENTKISETILITDEALTQKNVDTVTLPMFSDLKEDRSTSRESELAAAIPTKCTEMHDSDKDLRKHERNTIQLESTIAVNKCCNDTKTNSNGQIRPENPQQTDKKFVGNCGATDLTPADQLLASGSTATCHQAMFTMPIEKISIPDRIFECGHSRTETNHFGNEKVQLQTEMEQLEPPMSSSVSREGNKSPVCADHVVAHQSEHVDHSSPKINLQFCIPSTTPTWLELPKSLPNAAFRQKGRQDRNVVMLKDPMKRLWPVFYHENPVFLGFTNGWKSFAAANNLQAGDHCELSQDLDEEEPVYEVQITRK